MESSRLGKQVFLLLIALAIGQYFYYFPLLPEKVAIHFNFWGQPDRWTSRENFALLYWSVLGIVLLIFLGITYLLPSLPASLINIPHRDYWMSPEHREQTIRTLQYFFWWFNNLTLALLLVILHLSIQANRARVIQGRVAFWIPLLAYLLALVYLMIKYYRQFRLPRQNPPVGPT